MSLEYLAAEARLNDLRAEAAAERQAAIARRSRHRKKRSPASRSWRVGGLKPRRGPEVPHELPMTAPSEVHA